MASQVSQVAVPAGTWSVDPIHSSVEFQVKHMGLATVKGQFTEFEGSLVFDKAGGRAGGCVRVASVNTREPQRDAHLRSPDFFDAGRFPEITFQSAEIRSVEGATLLIVGDLTIHGITNRVELEAIVQGTGEDQWGNARVGVEVAGQISRSDYGMKFNQVLGSGNMLVGDRVKILLDISAVRA